MEPTIITYRYDNDVESGFDYERVRGYVDTSAVNTSAFRIKHAGHAYIVIFTIEPKVRHAVPNLILYGYRSTLTREILEALVARIPENTGGKLVEYHHESGLNVNLTNLDKTIDNNDKQE